jgi:acetoin utilization deacetylase AcuC-like enzyme
VLAVHDLGLTQYLATAWDEWETSGLTEEPGQDRVVPYLFAHPGLAAGDGLRAPAAISARAGYFAYDTMTLIGPGTWEAARAAVDVAVTAAELVVAGAPAAYACCRPPGHHVTRTCFGGSCYLNNSAAAAAHLREATGDRVAVIDIDAHHGNGTQSVFWEDTGVLTASVHVDPGAGWFPHFLGFEEETGAGANRNVPLPPGTGDERWVEAVTQLAEWAGEASALVVALGVDAAGGDPESPLEVSAEGFRAAGRALGALGVPTVVVQEGGYDLTAIGHLVHEVLAGIEEGASG